MEVDVRRWVVSGVCVCGRNDVSSLAPLLPSCGLHTAAVQPKRMPPQTLRREGCQRYSPVLLCTSLLARQKIKGRRTKAYGRREEMRKNKFWMGERGSSFSPSSGGEERRRMCPVSLLHVERGGGGGGPPPTPRREKGPGRHGWRQWKEAEAG